jgi:hypothetical protein
MHWKFQMLHMCRRALLFSLVCTCIIPKWLHALNMELTSLFWGNWPFCDYMRDLACLVYIIGSVCMFISQNVPSACVCLFEIWNLSKYYFKIQFLPDRKHYVTLQRPGDLCCVGK